MTSSKEITVFTVRLKPRTNHMCNVAYLQSWCPSQNRFRWILHWLSPHENGNVNSSQGSCWSPVVKFGNVIAQYCTNVHCTYATGVSRTARLPIENVFISFRGIDNSIFGHMCLTPQIMHHMVSIGVIYMWSCCYSNHGYCPRPLCRSRWSVVCDNDTTIYTHSVGREWVQLYAYVHFTRLALFLTKILNNMRKVSQDIYKTL